MPTPNLRSRHSKLSAPSTPITDTPVKDIPIPNLHAKATPTKGTPRQKKLQHQVVEPESIEPSLKPSGIWRTIAMILVIALSVLAWKYFELKQLQTQPTEPPAGHYLREITTLKHDFDLANEKLGKAEAMLTQLQSEFQVPDKEKQEPPKRVGIMRQLPESSVFCYHDRIEDRVCHIKNLCYLPGFEQFVIVVRNSSVVYGVPEDRKSRLVELTNLANHPQMYWDYKEIRQEDARFQNLNVSYEEAKVFLVNRYHASNIMHAFHDDAFNYYWLLKEFGDSSPPGSDYPFSLDHPFFYLDSFLDGDAIFMIKYFSNYPIRFRKDLSTNQRLVTCFKDAVVGSSKLTSWYQYGFNGPQGPIENKTVNGWHVKEAVEYLRKRSQDFKSRNTYHMFNTALENPTSNVFAEAEPYDPTKHDSPEFIGIIVRISNRLILNKLELAAALEQRFRMRVVFFKLETHPLEALIYALDQVKVLIGMHGAALILGAFARPGTVLLELYPYAVPPDNYTPYRSMSKLNGINLVYRYWVNKHLENNVPHPEYPLSHGGLNSLSPELQEEIKSTATVPPHKCCTDPFWLYRIYQDTIVDIPEILELVSSALAESSQMQLPKNTRFSLEPHPVEFVGCKSGKIDNSEQYYLDLSWTKPWNLPDPGPERYTVNVLSLGTTVEVDSRGPKEMVTIRLQPVSKSELVMFSIQSWVNGVPSKFGRKIQCEVGDYVGPAGVHIMDGFN